MKHWEEKLFTIKYIPKYQNNTRPLRRNLCNLVKLRLICIYSNKAFPIIVSDREVSFTNSNFDRVYLHFVTARGARIFSPATLLWSFDFVMWTCIGASTLLAFTVFKLISKSMEVLGIDNTETRGVTRKENWGIRHQLFFVMSSYLHQACVLPTYTPLRCFAAKWLFFVLVVTTVYRFETYYYVTKSCTTLRIICFISSILFLISSKKGSNL